jgi:hypothetical protein
MNGNFRVLKGHESIEAQASYVFSVINLPPEGAYYEMDRRTPTVPEGQPDRSLARSAWTAPPQENRPVGYGLIRLFGCSQIPEISPLQDSNHRLGAQTCTDHTVPYGTVLLGWRCFRHFVPGYDRAVPGLRIRRPLNTYQASAWVSIF